MSERPDDEKHDASAQRKAERTKDDDGPYRDHFVAAHPRLRVTPGALPRCFTVEPGGMLFRLMSATLLLIVLDWMTRVFAETGVPPSSPPPLWVRPRASVAPFSHGGMKFSKP